MAGTLTAHVEPLSVRPRRFLLITAALALAAVPAQAAPKHTFGKERPRTSVTCTGNPGTFQLLHFKAGGQTAKALYAVPARKPVGIVVFDHGYSHTMYSWVRHVERTAKQLGVIAVVPDYRGQVDDLKAQPLPSSRGWRVAEGAVDTNAVAALFDRSCLKGRGHNVLYSVSMGGNTAGLALAAKPKRLGGKPMFDEWVNVEGAANVLETYLGAKALAGVNEFADHAAADIEQEMGGTPQTAMTTYQERTVVNRVDDIAASGVKGVVMAHGYADGLVTHDIGRQLQLRLRAAGVPVDFRSFLTHTAGTEAGTTLDGYLPTGIASPFAGHASEVSETHDVGRAGFAALTELYRGHRVTNADSFDDGLSSLHLSGP
jgi:acetyl esterase/lipase